MFDGGAGGAGDDPRRADLPSHPVLAAPVAALLPVQQALESSGLALSRDEVGEALVATDALANTVHALRLHLIRMAEVREPPPMRHGTRPGTITAYWLKDLLGLTPGQGWANLNAARATDPELGTLKQMGAALAEGAIHAEQVDVAVRALAHIPASLVRERGDEIDALLTAHAKTFTHADSAILARSLLATLAPDGVEESADDAHVRRAATVRTDSTGMVVVKAQLDPVGGALFKTLLDHLDRIARLNGDGAPLGPGDEASTAGGAADASPDEADDEGGADGAGDEPLRPTRTGPQRLADDLVEMARLAGVGLDAEHPEAEPVQLVITVTEDELARRAAGEQGREGGHDEHAGQDDEPVASPAASAASADAGEDAGAGSSTDAGASSPSSAGAGAPGADAGAEPPAWARRSGPATCEATGVLSSRALQTLACDAEVQRVVIDRRGKVLRLDHLGRLANRAQRRALAVRDGGCAFPGCSAGASWSDAHHIVWWSRGGPTTLDNLCLLCQRHHSEIHREEWSIVVIDGLPWFKPPPWLDPRQTLRRNNRHRTAQRAAAFGLRLHTGEAVDDLLVPEVPEVPGPRAPEPSPQVDQQLGRDGQPAPPAPPPPAADGDPPDELGEAEAA